MYIDMLVAFPYEFKFSYCYTGIDWTYRRVNILSPSSLPFSLPADTGW